MKNYEADIQFGFEKIRQEFEKHLILHNKVIDSGLPDIYDKESIAIEKNISVEMRDGTILYADIYKPEKDGKFPTILTRMPYGKEEYYCYMPAIGKFWAGKGFAYVAQDVRGKYASTGNWEPFINEKNDGFDTVEWIAGQPWCSGNIGMMGESYYGYTCWAAAVANPPYLTCIAPSTTSMDIHNNWIYNNGAFCMQTMGVWASEMNYRETQNQDRLDHRHLPLIHMADEAELPCPYYKDWIRHPASDGYWENINLDKYYKNIDIPVLHLGGWYDTFLRSTIDDWAGVREHAENPEIRDKQWLRIGPFDHEYTAADTGHVGRIEIEDLQSINHWRVLERFFNHFLKGEQNGFDMEPKVQAYIMGKEKWLKSEQWPLPETDFKKYYFTSDGNANSMYGDGGLSAVTPEKDTLSKFVYDPENPVTIVSDVSMWRLSDEMKDRRSVEIRHDVLVFTGEILEENLEIAGPVKIKLFAASDAKDTDFTGTLVDVNPDGYAQLVQEGIIRASFRKSVKKRELIEPGKIYEYEIDLWATGYCFKKGHQIRVEISSSNFDRFDRNPNTGSEYGMDSEVQTAKQTIYHSNEYPSYIVLPVIP
ncbi:MAG: CocE/NonD family hydrolase [Desulfobacterales bacterium]|nr:CocE/NonD family hydrolase [Desulfobacterales bacterium]